MMRNQTFTVDLARSILSGGGLYHLAFSVTYGMSIWHTFIGGIIQIRTLPRQQFGALQAKTFPIYFGIGCAIPAGLLSHWILHHPDVASYAWHLGNADVLQAWTLATVIASQALNYFIIGPKATRVMFKRWKLERAEGKAYNEPGASDAVKKLAKSFGALHGISSLAYLISIIGLTFHGLWIAKFGTTGY